MHIQRVIETAIFGILTVSLNKGQIGSNQEGRQMDGQIVDRWIARQQIDGQLKSRQMDSQIVDRWIARQQIDGQLDSRYIDSQMLRQIVIRTSTYIRYSDSQPKSRANTGQIDKQLLGQLSNIDLAIFPKIFKHSFWSQKIT